MSPPLSDYDPFKPDDGKSSGNMDRNPPGGEGGGPAGGEDPFPGDENLDVPDDPEDDEPVGPRDEYGDEESPEEEEERERERALEEAEHRAEQILEAVHQRELDYPCEVTPWGEEREGFLAVLLTTYLPEVEGDVIFQYEFVGSEGPDLSVSITDGNITWEDPIAAALLSLHIEVTVVGVPHVTPADGCRGYRSPEAPMYMLLGSQFIATRAGATTFPDITVPFTRPPGSGPLAGIKGVIVHVWIRGMVAPGTLSWTVEMS